MTLEIMVGCSVALAMIAALLSPRLWIAVVAGLASGLIVWLLPMLQEGVTFSDAGGLFVLLVTLVLSLYTAFPSILAALAVYLLKRVIGAWRRRATEKAPADR
jgi:hypothetical protein